MICVTCKDRKYLINSSSHMHFGKTDYNLNILKIFKKTKICTISPHKIPQELELSHCLSST